MASWSHRAFSGCVWCVDVREIGCLLFADRRGACVSQALLAARVVALRASCAQSQSSRQSLVDALARFWTQLQPVVSKLSTTPPSEAWSLHSSLVTSAVTLLMACCVNTRNFATRSAHTLAVATFTATTEVPNEQDMTAGWRNVLVEVVLRDVQSAVQCVTYV